jgi:hypothetical protein
MNFDLSKYERIDSLRDEEYDYTSDPVRWCGLYQHTRLAAIISSVGFMQSPNGMTDFKNWLMGFMTAMHISFRLFSTMAEYAFLMALRSFARTGVSMSIRLIFKPSLPRLQRF